jgi:hypothetical protein
MPEEFMRDGGIKGQAKPDLNHTDIEYPSHCIEGPWLYIFPDRFAQPVKGQGTHSERRLGSGFHIRSSSVLKPVIPPGTVLAVQKFPGKNQHGQKDILHEKGH